MISLNDRVTPVLCVGVVLALAGCGGGDPDQESQAKASQASVNASAPQQRVVTPPKPPRASLVTSRNELPAADGLTVINADSGRPPATTQPGVNYITVEPAVLDLGTAATNQTVVGTVRLINITDKPAKVVRCQSNCGCTTANCPTGQEIAAGESREVEISVKTGQTARSLVKNVTFVIDGQGPVRLPIRVSVISYISVEPKQLNQATSADGRVVLRSTDDVPFTITSVNPGVVDGIDETPRVEHEVYVSWDQWKDIGRGYGRLTFTTDHPKASQVQMYVRGPSAQQQARNNLVDIGVVDAPLNVTPQPAAAMSLAIKKRDAQATKEALSLLTDPARRNQVLALAARRGWAEGVQILLDAGADIEARDGRGRTVLMSALQSRNIETVLELIEKGAEINARDNVGGTALSRAAGPFGNAEVLKALLATKAEVNVADNNGMTPLHWAARYGDAERIELLLGAGANLGARDKTGLTALGLARRRADPNGPPIVELLRPLLEGEAEASAGSGG